jgi:hypothetical protein
MAQLVEVLHYKADGYWFDFPWDNWDLSLT